MNAAIDNAPAIRPGPQDGGQGSLFSPPAEPSPNKPGERYDDFDWATDEAVIMQRQQGLAVYRNQSGGIVLRIEREWDEDADPYIALNSPEAVEKLIASLQMHLREWKQERRG